MTWTFTLPWTTKGVTEAQQTPQGCPALEWSPPARETLGDARGSKDPGAWDKGGDLDSGGKEKKHERDGRRSKKNGKGGTRRERQEDEEHESGEKGARGGKGKA